MSDPQIQSSRDATQRCICCQKNPTALGGLRMKKCSRCNTTMYCSPNCQAADWPKHKLTCLNPTVPTILIIAVGGNDYLLETSAAHLLAALRKYANLMILVTLEEAMAAMTSIASIRAVVLADGALETNRRYGALKAAVKSYVETGGIVILGATFAEFIRPDKFGMFMADCWGLPWTFGNCYRTVVNLNRENVSDEMFKDARLAVSYSQKAVFLKGVELEDRVYVPGERSETQNILFVPGRVDQSQTPVSWAKVKEGWLGYVGDISCEGESTMVVLAMCGLGLEE